MLDGHLHVGVVPLISPLSGLEYLPLYDEHAQLYCSRGHALLERADGDIAVDEVLAADAVAPSYRLPAEAQARHQELNNSASASDREGMAFLILTGNFIGYLPSHYAADWVAAGMLRPPAAGAFPLRHRADHRDPQGTPAEPGAGTVPEAVAVS